MNLAIKLSVLAVPLLLAVAPADAAPRRATDARAQASEPVGREMSPQAMAVRERCMAQALKVQQNGDEARATQSPQSVIYSQCVMRDGYRP